MRTSAQLTLLLAVALARPAPAAAQSPPADPTADDPQARAGESFELGMRLMEEQNWSGALAAFERAYQLAPHYAVLFNIGFCQKQLQRYPEALASFERYLADGGEQVRPEKRAEAEQAIADLRLLLAEVVVTVDRDGAEVLVDERVHGTSPLAEPLVLGAGHHVVIARARDHRDARAEFDLAPGERLELELVLEPLVAVAPGPPAGPEPPPPPAEPPAWYEDWLGWTLGGVGFVATGVGLGFVGGAAVKEGNADDEPNMETQHALYEEAAAGNLLGSVLAGVGGALLVTGIVLLAIPEAAPEASPEAAAGVAWLPLVGPGSLGLHVRF
jgi:hypothetical protein